MVGIERIVIYSPSKIFHLPNWLSQLYNLKNLDLYRARIHSIPADLLKTKLPFITDPLSRASGINLSTVLLEEGNITLFSQSREIIEEYYSGVKERINECKVIFLGEAFNGKSSLIKRILYDEFDDDRNNPPTEGIHIEICPVEILGEHMRLRILDFGGQEIMHAMHRCFMTQHTVYVLVCDSRKDGEIDREAARWLKNISSFAPGCPVILALNKADLNKNVSVNESNLRDINPSLMRPILTSAKWEKAEGTNQLFDEIKLAALAIRDNSQGNESIIALKQALEDMPDYYITGERYRKLCSMCNVKMDKEYQISLLKYFKDLGICYNYSSPKVVTKLEDFRILKPEWLTNGIYRLILRTPKNGILRHEEIKNTLEATHPEDIRPEIVYTSKETDYILHVMREFEISHKMADGKELIPLKLGKSIPQDAKTFDKSGALHLSWNALYLPNTIIHRLMIRKYNELVFSCLWQSGAIFRREKEYGMQSAYVNMSDNCIDVYVQGVEKRHYMEEFRREVINILGRLNMTPTEMIHFRWEGEMREVDYEQVNDLYKRSKDEVYVRGAVRFPNPATILQENYVKENERIQMILISGNKNTVTMGGSSSNFATASEVAGSLNVGNMGYSLDALRNSILQCEKIRRNDYELIIAQLETIVKHKSVSSTMRNKIKTVINKREKPSAWQYVRNFLGDAANFATIIAAVPTILDIVKKIFT